MSTYEDDVRQGRLEEALAGLQAAIRKAPADAKPRVLLFQLLSVMGQWERAMTQLNVIGDLDVKALPMVQTYRTALKCEELRAEVFAGKRTPLLFEAFDLAPTATGKIDDQPFAWLADADTRLGPVLEAIIDGKYYWIPFGNLTAIKIEKPADLRDLAWIPAYLTSASGGEVVALIPTRYPGSETSVDAAIRLARKTEWLSGKDGACSGLGQRMLATDQGDYPLLEIRSIAFDPSPVPVGNPVG